MSTPEPPPPPPPTPPPRRRATAIQYTQGDRAPKVTATGTGLVAERIIAAAREAGVPVREDAALANALTTLDLGDEVPEAMWVAVAETLAWAYRLNAQA